MHSENKLNLTSVMHMRRCVHDFDDRLPQKREYQAGRN